MHIFQIEVEENSSKLLCINTHRGLYKFNRLAFGVKVAPDIFQQVMDAMLGETDFETAYLDILITSKSVTEHRKHIMCVSDKLQEYDFKVKDAKCNFFQTNKILDDRWPDPDRATTYRPQTTSKLCKASLAWQTSTKYLFKICIV